MHRLDEKKKAFLLRCDCGVSLFVSPKGWLVTAIESNAPTFDSPASSDSSVLAIDSFEPEMKRSHAAKEPFPDKSSDGPLSNKSNRRKTPWLAIIGFSSVVVFLIASIVMFAFRIRDPDLSDKNPSQARIQQLIATTSSKKKLVIKSGTLSELASKVPSPILEEYWVPMSDDVTSVAASPEVSVQERTKQSPFGGRTIKPKTLLAQKNEPRPRIPIIAPATSALLFDDAYNQAYQAYESLMKLGESAEESEEYKKQLGETLGKVKAAYKLSLRNDDTTRRNELVYLLAFLSHKAGRVMESAIYGETAARFGEASENSSRDGAFIALAAAQEAAANHWGTPDEVGELQLMETIAEIIDQRWPDEEQCDNIWLNLGGLYASMWHHDLAIPVFEKIEKHSTSFVDARMAQGAAHWTIFLIDASVPNAAPEQMVALLNKASGQYKTAVETLEKELDQPTMALLTAKQMLAIIAERKGETDAVLHWTTEGKFPLIESIRVSKSGRPKAVMVPAAFAKNVFELLYQAKTDAGDIQGAKESLAMLDDVIGAQGEDDIHSKHIATAVRQFKELLGQEMVTMKDILSLDESMVEVLSTSSSATVQDKLWMAQSWATLAEKTPNAKVAKECFGRAVSICETELERETIPENLVTSTRVRQAEWLRRTGKPEASLKAISAILMKTPNVLELQMQAAIAREELAIAHDSEDELRHAIDGDSDSQSIWGWAKLTGNLHRLRYSDRGTPKIADLLLESHFHLARCRWMLATVLGDDQEAETLKKQTSKQLGSAQLAISEECSHADQWKLAFKKIDDSLISSPSP